MKNVSPIRGLTIGIVLIFLLSSVSPMVLGFDSEKVDMSMQSVDGPMDSPWPMKSYNLHHTGQSPYSTADNPLIEKWRFECSWVEGGPIIDNDGTIYFGESDDYLYALYPNGTMKWRYKAGSVIWSSVPSIDEDGVVYVGSWDNYLHAVNPDGTRKWRFNAHSANIDSSPTVGYDGTIYIGTLWSLGNGGKLHALNPDGTERWFYQTGDAVSSNPAIGDDGTIYFGSYDDYLYALYPNGTLRWRYQSGNQIRGSPSIGENDTIYFGSCDGYLYALYPNGTLRWRYRVGGTIDSNPSIGNDGTIYIGYDELCAVNSDGTLKWNFDLGEDRFIRDSSPCISSDGTIYVGLNIGNDAGGEAIALNPDGTEHWRSGRLVNFRMRASPCIGTDGTVYFGSGYQGGGYIHAFGEIESNQPPNTPVISGETNGEVNEGYWYAISCNDPDNNPVSFYIDWGDGNEGWELSKASGEVFYYEHAWTRRGDYSIRVKARDVMGEESDWATLEVTMPRNKYTNIIQELDDNITIDIKGGIGITIEINNNGDTSISLVNWSFILDCPLLFFGWTSEGSILEISPGASETIRARVLGLGSITITVQVNDIIESRNGFIIGPFVLLKDGGI